MSTYFIIKSYKSTYHLYFFTISSYKNMQVCYPKHADIVHLKP